MKIEPIKNNRKVRETNFHNKRYSSDPRTKLSLFYTLSSNTKRLYHNAIINNSLDKRILELGCGFGGFAQELAEGGSIVSGIDISSVAIEQAIKGSKEKNLNIDFKVMDAENLDYRDCYFDTLYGTGILHHLDLKRSLSEVKRVLKVDGVCIFLEPLGHNPFINLFRLITPSLRTKDEHPLTEQDLEFILQKFSSSRISHHHLTTFFALPLLSFRFSTKIIKILESLDECLFERVPLIKKYSWMVLLMLHRSEIK